MSLVPYDLLAKSLGSGYSATNWTNLLSIPVASLKKRQSTSSMSVGDLHNLCPLNNVQNKDVVAGCIVGLYNKFCKDPMNLIDCHSNYDMVVSASIFKPLGVCAAWKSGPASSTCMAAITNFKVTLGYLTLTSINARDFVSSIFASRVYAPCLPITGKVVCNWS